MKITPEKGLWIGVGVFTLGAGAMILAPPQTMFMSMGIGPITLGVVSGVAALVSGIAIVAKALGEKRKK